MFFQIKSLSFDCLYQSNYLLDNSEFELPKLVSEEALAERWIDWNDSVDTPFKITDIENFYDIQKIYFLNYLLNKTLTQKKMDEMARIYEFENQNDEIR